MSAGSITQIPGKQWAVERVPSLNGHQLRVYVYLATADGETVQKKLPILQANADENLRISFAGAASTANGNTPLYVLAASERPHEYTAVRLDAENMLISSVAPTYTVRKNRLNELVNRSASKVPAAAYSSFLNEMWRNSENPDFWKSAELSGEEYSLLDESIDAEMGGTGVLPTAVALPSPLVEDGKEAECEKEFEWKTVQTGYMIYKDELTKLENVPKMNYVGTILDVIYDFDTELSEHALSEPDLIKFIDAFAALTTSPDWTILIFCGFAQQTGFLKILESKCNGGAQRIWWRKENQDVGANQKIRYNVLEAAVIGFQMADQESGEKSTRKPWMCDFDFSSKDAEAGSRANVLEGYSVVKQPYRDDGKVVCAHQKPQHLLIELINCHMMGPAPFARLNNDSSPNWILDAGCGVATATMAALRCGLNAVAFDSDQDMVNAASQRIGNINDEPNGDTECMSLEETAKLKEEARIEEENLKRAKEIADCKKDMQESADEDGEEPAEDPPAETGTASGQPEAGEGEKGEDGDEEEEGEAGDGEPGDSVPPAPTDDAPAE
ncbi:hypothetical protein CYMTET_55575 [Cymbomonas tetramitiformis]|uniref:Methyltransferase n=1 Tax=Cymbomonas tetramitiformis TaxID=36881 RepID=A0AAE0BCP5_9CHLO|nr:hypothetical protein CYMTET_55575 [Cymbomonas tetramitiformis]